ncbi:MAG TPA: hypothetical protein VF549_01625 [Solirubrobacteraceae bacterium]|jgi:hypothetical protein
MRPLRLVSLALIVLLTGAAVAHAAVYDVKRVLGDDLPRVAKKTQVPVRLPTKINLDYGKNVFGSGTGSKNRYSFGIDAAQPCGANACFLAQFRAEKGGEPAFDREVLLAKGITGYYKPLTCGGSCSPPMIEWVQGGYLYGIQAKVGVSGKSAQRRAMVRAANSSILATPR